MWPIFILFCLYPLRDWQYEYSQKFCNIFLLWIYLQRDKKSKHLEKWAISVFFYKKLS